jgi:hypothetical protein
MAGIADDVYVLSVLLDNWGFIVGGGTFGTAVTATAGWVFRRYRRSAGREL